MCIVPRILRIDEFYELRLTFDSQFVKFVKFVVKYT